MRAPSAMAKKQSVVQEIWPNREKLRVSEKNGLRLSVSMAKRHFTGGAEVLVGFAERNFGAVLWGDVRH